MLRYLIAVTEDLFSPAILLGMLTAYVSLAWGKRGLRTLAWGSGLGFAAAVWMAYMKNATSKIDTGGWNLRIFALSLLALAAFWILSIRPLRARLGTAGTWAVPVCAGALAFTFLFYALPNDLAYPFTFSLNGESVFSTAFFYRLTGWLLGILLAVLAYFAVSRCAARLETRLVSVLLNAVLLINGAHQASKILQTLLTRRIIPPRHPLYHSLFVIARYTSNYSGYFLYAAMLATVSIPVALWVRSFRSKEPYDNPAQHRKIRASWRSARRWASLMAACFLMGTLNVTVVSAIQNRPVELSPAEEFETIGDNLYVPLERLEDGHLHRFEYTTPNGVGVRFILIKKPNSSSYGVGLDACEICGATGYYERKGQIVCKLCDVVMNINTIGFKGGCNPMVIDYSVEGGYIVIPTYTLIDHEKTFQ